MTRAWPAADRFGLGDQLRRASISIGANIAEGCGRNGDPEFARFLTIALGSATELHYLLIFARDATVAAIEATDPLIARTEEVLRMLAALHAAAASGVAPRRRLARPTVRKG